MIVKCAWCDKELGDGSHTESTGGKCHVSHGICEKCQVFLVENVPRRLDEFVEKLEQPVLAVDGMGGIIAANIAARASLGNRVENISGKGWGDIVECANARKPGGCGCAKYCQTGCVIRKTLKDTFETGRSFSRVPAVQDVYDGVALRQRRVLITTEKLGEIVLMRMEGPEESA